MKTAHERRLDELAAKIPKGPHDSNEDRKGRYIPCEHALKGIPRCSCPIEYEWVPVPCGEWYNGGRALCDAHIDYYKELYPQGWSYYPGDVCEHGVYVGGCGIDWMCPACEGLV